MSSLKNYILNPETLMYEIKEVSLKSRFFKYLGLFLGSSALALLYIWIYADVLGLPLPKTMILEKNNARWSSKVEILDRQIDRYDQALDALAMRDDDIYRSIFGMNELPGPVRNSGLGGEMRYAELDNNSMNSLLLHTAVGLDNVSKKAYVQSTSFDEIMTLSKRADDMASCIPAIPPLCPDMSKIRLTSRFGYRSDPMNGRSTMHTGFDFACKPGNPVYSTGDGVVESVNFEFYGYGNSVIIDHGFGYKTRYAHLSVINVVEGMKLKRGDCIGESGNSGKSTGPHLHYEVMYRDSYVNPENYFDLDITIQEYNAMVNKSASESEAILRQPFRIKQRK